MNDLSKSLKILVDRYPGTMAELCLLYTSDAATILHV